MLPSSIKNDFITDGTKLIDGVWLHTNTYDMGIFCNCFLHYGGCFQSVMGFPVSPDLFILHVAQEKIPQGTGNGSRKSHVT